MTPERLRAWLDAVLPTNPFYAAKLPNWRTLDQWDDVPFTTKAELVADQAAHPPYGTNHTGGRPEYIRLHQTSGTTTGRPLRWLDTHESWTDLLDCWEQLLRLAGVSPTDVCMFPFSFGPFLGFWTAFEAAQRYGCLALPGGGLSTSARLRLLLDNRATVVFCTPTYALHMAEIAAQESLDLAASAVRLLIVAGEPGGNVPATRQRIETAWGAKVVDHYGLTEVGPMAIETAPNSLDVLDEAYFTELVDAEGRVVPPGAIGELIVTTLKRLASPVLRYRTGDLARRSLNVHTTTRYDGGILGRVDDMIHIRGNNVYPTAIEAIVRRFPTVAEFRMTVTGRGPMTELVLELELVPGAETDTVTVDVSRTIQDELLFRPVVRVLPPNTLPRFELKARRLIRTP